MADFFWGGGDLDGNVPAVGASERARLARDRLLDENFERLIHEIVVERHGQFAFEEGETIASLFFQRSGYLIGKTRRRGPASSGEGEDMDLHEADTSACFEGFLEFLVGFARKPHDDVGGKGGAVEAVVQAFDPFHEFRHAVASSHPPEDRFGTGLE